MRNIRTIVAVAATIIMLGAVAQAQTWNPSNVQAGDAIPSSATGFGMNGSGSGNWFIYAPNNTNLSRAISSFYMEDTGTRVISVMGTQTVTVGNYYAVAGALNKTKNNNVNGKLDITNYWLQVGNELADTNKVTLNTDSISVVGITGGQTASSGTNNFHVANYGVDITSNGKVNALDMFGGTVTNNGKIGSLLFGSGTYSGTGTVESLNFQVGANFDIGSITASNYNLAGANLTFDAGVFAVDTYDFGFGDNVTWTGFKSLTVTGDADWDAVSALLAAAEYMLGEYAYANDLGKYLVTFSEAGIEVASAPVPEPATLAVLGLGLAGLGLARRRK